MESLPENHFLFTSESVTMGHPDKLCDIVSDSILDAVLAVDPNGFCACQSAVKGNLLMILGEVTFKGEINYEQVARNAIKEIGYDDIQKGFDYKRASIILSLDKQSSQINSAVQRTERPEDIGAGDQGLMFGYASNETEECMPLTISICNKLVASLESNNKSRKIPWLRPDGKVQVTIEYEKVGSEIKPHHIHTVLVSTQHDPSVSNEELRQEIKKKIILPVLPPDLVSEKTKFIVNPSDRFVLGGPMADAGLTGRKIIADSYGGWGGHGGGAFSGKDPTKVDRSGAYAARQIAKSLVANKFCSRCVVQVSYGIGIPQPLSIYVDSYGTGVVPDSQLVKIVARNFDLRPGMLIKNLNLRRPIYRKTASGGHFKHDPDFEWEKVKDLSHELKK